MSTDPRPTYGILGVRVGFFPSDTTSSSASVDSPGCFLRGDLCSGNHALIQMGQMAGVQTDRLGSGCRCRPSRHRCDAGLGRATGMGTGPLVFSLLGAVAMTAALTWFLRWQARAEQDPEETPEVMEVSVVEGDILAQNVEAVVHPWSGSALPAWRPSSGAGRQLKTMTGREPWRAGDPLGRGGSARVVSTGQRFNAPRFPTRSSLFGADVARRVATCAGDSYALVRMRDPRLGSGPRRNAQASGRLAATSVN